MSAVARVLQISGTMNRGGAETFLMNLYRQIDRSLWQFDFVCFGEARGDYDDEIEAMGGRIVRVPGRGLGGWTLGLYRFLKAHPEYRIVHSHTGFASAYFLAAARIAGVRHRFLHGHNATLKAGLSGRVYGAASRLLGRFAATRRLSCGTRAALELHGTMDGVELFPNCIALDAFGRDPEARRRVRAEFGVDDGQKLVIQVGRLEPVKNHRFTLDLCERLDKDSALKVVTIGCGSLEAWFAAEIKRRGLEEIIVHAGLRRDIPAFMAAADAMIMPSFHEGFPLVAVEAQAAGLTCLMSSTVDPDVDLQMGLVRFVELNVLEAWHAALTDLTPRGTPAFEERKAKLSSLGFDSSVAAERLTQLLGQVSGD